MPDLKTTQETTRSSIDGTELVRLATTGANWKATLSDVFTTLGGHKVTTAAVTYYVSTTGNDSNNGLTVGTPFRTIQKGIDTATQTYMYAQPAAGTHNPIIVQLADGTYDECPFLPPWLGYQYAGAGITLQGNIADKTKVIIKPSTLPRNLQGIISQTGMSIWTISFLTLDGTLNTFYSMLDSSDGCIQFANDIKFINSTSSTSAVAYGLSCFGGLFGACEFVGSFDNVTFLSYQTTWYLSAALTFTSAPTFTTGILTSAVDVNMYLQFVSSTGSPVGRKFSLADRSFIYSNADVYPLSSLPGSLDGVMDDTSGFQDTKGFRSLAALPSATQMVPGSWGVFKNNADSTVYIAANDGGVIKRTPIPPTLNVLSAATTYYVAILAGTIVGGTLYTAGTYNAVSLTGGSGTGAKANITISGGGVVTDVVPTVQGSGYVAGDVLSVAAASVGGTGSGFTFTLTGVGSDSNDGSTIAKCFRTWTKAYTTIAGYSLVTGYLVNVNISDGVYDEQLIAYPLLGAGIQQVFWNGNNSKPGNCVLKPTTRNVNFVGVLTIEGRGNFFKGIHFDASDPGFGGFECIFAADADGDFQHCEFSIAANDFWAIAFIGLSNLGFSDTYYNIDGTQLSVFAMGTGATIGGLNVVITGSGTTLLSGTPSFAAGWGFAAVENFSAYTATGTFTGWGSSTGIRFNCTGQSVIQTPGNETNATYIPGNTAGTIDFSSALNGSLGSASGTSIPTTTQLPVTGTCGLFKDTGGGGVYLAYNDAGTIKKVALV